ncbi:MAG TPA: site-2 protease family protein [Gemmatimonadales bacterium]|nr:site-2 protease family protein [Gemmatimonadales bacterium]
MAAALLSCPSCGWLRFSQGLKRLAAEAEEHERAGRFSEALVAWRSALDLLPLKSGQYAVIEARIAELGRQGPAKAAQEQPPWTRRAGVLGAIALFLWKFKIVIAFLLTKGKLLLLGLTKAGTLFSMLLSLGVYWQAFGWKWAFGVVASIYVHEMGHVAMLRHYGIPATAPMFLPGVGAVIRSRFYPKDVVAQARVGLAGPIWGLAAALTCYIVYVLTGLQAWGALAEIGAWINLFNLTPVWQLDGAHGFKALSRQQRWIAVAAIAGAWVISTKGLLILLLIFAVMAALKSDAPDQPDRRTLIEYLLLIAALTALATVPVPVSALD